MVRLNDDYFIEVDELNYTLKRDNHKVYKDKTGKERMSADVIGYYPTLHKAFLGARDYFIGKSLQGYKMSLGKAVERIEIALKEFEDMLNERGI